MAFFRLVGNVHENFQTMHKNDCSAIICAEGSIGSPFCCSLIALHDPRLASQGPLSARGGSCSALGLWHLKHASVFGKAYHFLDIEAFGLCASAQSSHDRHPMPGNSNVPVLAHLAHTHSSTFSYEFHTQSITHWRLFAPP